MKQISNEEILQLASDFTDKVRRTFYKSCENIYPKPYVNYKKLEEYFYKELIKLIQ